MTKFQMVDIEGKSVDTIELADDIFNVEINEHVVYLVVKNILANRRQGTQSAKTRAEVRGGGRKPWRQKGTGRARQGSIRSPQWRGGGIVFAAKPRSYRYTTPKKVRRLAMKSVLTSKVQEEELIVVDKFALDAPKTSAFAKHLNAMGAKDKALFVTADESDKNLVLSARNLKNVKVLSVGTLNVYDILKYDSLILTKDALDKLVEVYN
ncbi:50S ribosomal protein L4 [Aedoeadaptatus nemausensis]|uniref:Large ribosomal subunit protein uL4 n=1 Tax=Aedoeadaptatus nemausensis TaxID=2582829 RepID=A0A6V6Y6A1_9FIRM|nr:50S ribosomal protein L4 [Peptoniphilus nemausensis]CAC9934259.1 50S ribosomal protein L4 [Peptoniphilus nemausensis]